MVVVVVVFCFFLFEYVDVLHFLNEQSIDVSSGVATIRFARARDAAQVLKLIIVVLTILF